MRKYVIFILFDFIAIFKCILLLLINFMTKKQKESA